MKKIAKLLFKIHRLIYGYPCRSEVRLGIEQYHLNGGLTWYIGMLYICEENFSDISLWLDISDEEIKFHLNKIAKGVIL
jgi:hypothetical protein